MLRILQASCLLGDGGSTSCSTLRRILALSNAEIAEHHVHFIVSVVLLDNKTKITTKSVVIELFFFLLHCMQR